MKTVKNSKVEVARIASIRASFWQMKQNKDINILLMIMQLNYVAETRYVETTRKMK